MNLKLLELTKELQKNRIPLEPYLRSGEMYFRDPDGRPYTYKSGQKVLVGGVNKTIARELGLQELWYDKDGMRLIFPSGYSFDEGRLAQIGEAVNFNNPNGYENKRSAFYIAEMLFTLPSAMQTMRDALVKDGYDEKEILPICQKIALGEHVYDFEVPIGLCEIKSIPERFSLWGRETGYHDLTGQHCVTGRVTAYPLKIKEEGFIGIEIQRKPVVVGIPFDSGYHRGEVSVSHSHMPPHDHPSEVSGINDVTIALAQQIVDEALVERPYSPVFWRALEALQSR